MTSTYFQSIINELNENCNFKHLPTDKKDFDQECDYRFKQREIWYEEDVCINKNKELYYRDYCCEEITVDSYLSPPTLEYTYVLCQSCKNILNEKVINIYERTNVELIIEIKDLKKELNEVKTLLQKLIKE